MGCSKYTELINDITLTNMDIEWMFFAGLLYRMPWLSGLSQIKGF